MQSMAIEGKTSPGIQRHARLTRLFLYILRVQIYILSSSNIYIYYAFPDGTRRLMNFTGLIFHETKPRSGSLEALSTERQRRRLERRTHRERKRERLETEKEIGERDMHMNFATFSRSRNHLF